MTRIYSAIPRRNGFTLVELLVSSAIAVSVIAAVASIFAVFARTASNSQAIVDMSGRLRAASNLLRQDLLGSTAPLTPPLAAESGAGYFEIIEGPASDAFRIAGSSRVAITGTDSIQGDVDDVLRFTTQSATPFLGRLAAAQIESPIAEVVWSCTPATYQPVPGLVLRNLYRRQFLIFGHVGVSPFVNNVLTGSSLPAAYDSFDVSLRVDPRASNALVPNSLVDVMRRENRAPTGLVFSSASGRQGEDIVLTNVIGFDVLVFDPDAVPRQGGTGANQPAIYPHEQGYSTLTISGSARGGFIDLGCLVGTGVTPTILSGTGATNSGLAKTAVTGTATYDTWTTSRELDAVNDDGDSLTDEGADGADIAGVGIVGLPDDEDEQERPPPYAKPLRAIEIRIRCYDPTSREIRQVSVRHQFMN